MNKSLDQKKAVINRLSKFREPFLDDMGCEISNADPQKMVCEMDFDIGRRYCHSGDIIQGGFVTAMLDAVTTHAIFASVENVTAVATLELKVSFLGASRRGKLSSIGRIDKLTKSIAFLSGELRNSEGDITATISTTAKFYVKRNE